MAKRATAKAKTRKPRKAKSTAASAARAPGKARKVKAPEYKTFRLQKRIKHPADKLPGAYQILRTSLAHLWRHRRVFGGIVFVYLILTYVFVMALQLGVDAQGIKDLIRESLQGAGGEVTVGIAVFAALISNPSGELDKGAALFQSLLLILVSLALIWALRQTHADNKVSTRDAYYKGMYPLIPFVLVLAVVGLQLIPFGIGNFAYTLATQSDLARTALELVIWLLFFIGMAVLSFYMITSSIFATYIVALPDVRPMQALRTARELVRFRRWTVMRKVLFLPFALIILAAIIMLPLIFFATAVVPWVYFLLTMVSLAVLHSYMYFLYRELL